MALTYPPIDPRRARALLALLERIAPALSPQWTGAGEEGTFGRALFEIAARLAEETTWRLDRIPQRDALAFLDELDIPPAPPHAAEATLVFALNVKRTTSALAPARVQVAADVDGTEVVFETKDALELTPARLADVFTLDPAADRIERSPAEVTALQRLDLPVARYEVVSFADARSPTLQVSPALGLAEGDLIRIGGLAHRVSNAEDGLLALVEPLEAPAPAGAAATKIATLEAFDLRNLQRHEFYVGHAELLNLEQPAEITLTLRPSGLARRMSELNVVYSLWGKKDDEDQAEWHDLGQVSAAGTELLLVKSWTGPVEEREVDGVKSRWLRAKLQDPIEGRAGIGARATRLSIKVKTPDPDESEEAEEGSRTVTQAFHNGTPLSVSSRFFPFGAEPQRFDTFALAAPEALSKKGANIDLKIAMVEASLRTLVVTESNHTTERRYGVGKNGHLQALISDQAGGFLWRELDLPSAESIAPARLSVHIGLQAVQATSLAQVRVGGPLDDIVIVNDQDGRLWSGLVPGVQNLLQSIEPVTWTLLPKLNNENVAAAGVALAPNAFESGFRQSAAYLFAPAAGQLHVLRLNAAGGALGGWQSLTGGPLGAAGDPVPDMAGRAARVVPIQGADWPRPAGSPSGDSGVPSGGDLPPLQLALLDNDGSVWRGTVELDPAPSKVLWALLDGDHPAQLDIRPAASFFTTTAGDSALWVAWAANSDHRMWAVRQLGEELSVFDFPPHDVPPAALGTALHANPHVQGHDDRLITVGLGIDDAGDGVAVQLIADDDVRTVALPSGETSRQLYLFPSGARDIDLVFGGGDETLVTGTVSFDTMVAHVGDCLTIVGDRHPQYVELTRDERSHVIPLDGLDKIVEPADEDTDTRVVYLIEDAVDLQPDETYRLLGRVADSVTGLDGTVLSNNHRRLNLAEDDTELTQGGHWLIIDGELYEVMDVSDSRIATLDRRVALSGDGHGVRYVPVEVLVETDVTAQDLGTLVHLPDESEQPEAQVLRFEGASPGRQPIVARSDPVGGEVWIKLGEPWAVRPRPVTRAWPAPEPDLAVEQASAAWLVQRRGQEYQNPELSWEYFDGDGWRRLETGFVDETRNLATTGSIRFRVPETLQTTDVAGQDDYWIRARLVGGDYGRARYIVETEGPSGIPPTTTQTVKVDTSQLRPPEIDSIEARFKLDVAVEPETLLVRNNLATLDQTQAATTEQARFELFEGAKAIEEALATDPDATGRALYLGFTQRIDVTKLVLLADVDDQDGEGRLQGDVLTADGWREVAVEDQTESLRRRGLVSLFVNLTPAKVGLLGQERFWVRLWPEAPAARADWAPVVRGLYPNAAPASQAKTVEQEILGSSLGEPDMVVELAERPVLPDSVELRVREQLSEEETEALNAEQRRLRRLGSGAADTEVIVKVEDIPGTWVRWRPVDSFVGSDGDARVYLLDPATGRVTFGDGTQGKIPPAGSDAIRAFVYQKSEGELGNIEAWTELKPKSAPEAVDTVILPVESAGGLAAPDRDVQIATSNERLRHAGQALTPADLEALAVGSSPSIVRARCLRPVRPTDPIRLAVAQRNGSRCPIPSLAERHAIARHLLAAGWGGLGPQSIEVVGPVYVELQVTATLVAPSDRIAQVEADAEQAVLDFLHPGAGGPDGSGWPFGRRVWPSDLLRVLSGVDGVDRITEVDVRPLDDSVSLEQLPATALVCIEEENIDVQVEPMEGS